MRQAYVHGHSGTYVRTYTVHCQIRIHYYNIVFLHSVLFVLYKIIPHMVTLTRSGYCQWLHCSWLRFSDWNSLSDSILHSTVQCQALFPTLTVSIFCVRMHYAITIIRISSWIQITYKISGWRRGKETTKKVIIFCTLFICWIK